MEPIITEVRQTLRGFAQRPTYTLVAVLALAVGIGSIVTVFAVVNWLLIRPLPGVGDPNRLVTIRAARTEGGLIPISEVERVRIEGQVPSLGGVAAYAVYPIHIAVEQSIGPMRLDAQIVSGNYFDVLGRGTIVRGRGFTLQEGTESAHSAVAVISSRLWRRYFSGRDSTIGSSVNVNGRPFTVVGIAVPGFHGSERTQTADLWVPLAAHAVVLPLREATMLSNPRAIVYYALVARLRPQATVAGTSADLEVVRQRFIADDPSSARLQQFRFVADAGVGQPVLSYIQGRLVNAAVALLGASGLLWILACANVSNLVLARARGRRAEFAVQLALGASRASLVRRALGESVWLAGLGAVGGLVMGWCALSAVAGLTLLPTLPPMGDMSIDVRVFLAVVVLTTLTAGFISILPAIAAGQGDIRTALTASARSVVPRRRRAHQVFVIAQVAVSIVLLVGAGLLLRSMNERHAIDPGFDLQRVLTFTVDPSLHGVPLSRLQTFYLDLATRVRSIPGVENASVASFRPFSVGFSRWMVRADGAPESDGATADGNRVGPGYFQTLGIRLVDGREFVDSDLDEANEATQADKAIVNRSLAVRLFGTSQAVGRQIVVGSSRREIVGVASDVRSRLLMESPPFQLYYPFGQGTASVLARLSAPLDAVMPHIRDAVRAVDDSLPLYDAGTLAEAVERHLAESTLLSRLSVILAALAGLLAAVGIYAVCAMTVQERRRELAIRAAVGADARRLARMITWEAMRTSLVGAAVGLLAAVWLVRVIQGYLFGVTPLDPVSYGAAIVVVVMMTLVSTLLPAYRAALSNPSAALRE